MATVTSGPPPRHLSETADERAPARGAAVNQAARWVNSFGFTRAAWPEPWRRSCSRAKQTHYSRPQRRGVRDNFLPQTRLPFPTGAKFTHPLNCRGTAGSR